MRLAFIYTLADPRTGEIRYVGKTFDMAKRLKEHIKNSRGTRCASWVKSLANDGVVPVMEVLEETPEADVSAWQEAEFFWIETLRFYGCPLTNLVTGGIGGIRIAPETKEKLRKANLGRKFTDEERAACSEAHRGLKMSEQQRAGLVEITKRRWKDPAYRAKMSAMSGARRVSEVSKKRHSDATKRVFATMSPEKKAAWRASLRNALTKDVYKRISEKLSGRPLSQEHRQKLSLAKLGKPATPQSLAAMKAGWTPEVIARRAATLRATLAAKKVAREEREAVRV